jgi:beta-lactamase superfamily II metal-dependent hydrolase
LFYLVLIAVTFAGGSLKSLVASLRAKVQPIWLAILIVVLLAGSLLAWRLVGAAPDGRLHVTFLDVGSADAILIQTTAGRHVLINGGPSTTRVSDALGRRLSPFNHDLDMLIVASGDEQQVASLPRLLPRFPPQMILFGASAEASFSCRPPEHVAEDGIPMTRAEPDSSSTWGRAPYSGCWMSRPGAQRFCWSGILSAC